MANEHDEAIEKVLAALKNAAPPDGMEARIAQRLEHHTAARAHSGWRNLVAGSTLASAWWRGALSGIATAAAVAAIVLLAQHHSPNSAGAPVAATHGVLESPGSSSSRAPAALVSQTRARPCEPATSMHVRISNSAPKLDLLRAESVERSRPAPQLALTEQERGLMRLARSADPKQLAVINTEAHARLDAEDRTESLKFVTPPPIPPTEEPDAIEDQHDAPPEGDPQ